MCIDDFEKNTELLRLRMKLLEIEQEQLNGGKTYSLSDVKNCIHMKYREQKLFSHN